VKHRYCCVLFVVLHSSSSQPLVLMSCWLCCTMNAWTSSSGSSCSWDTHKHRQPAAAAGMCSDVLCCKISAEGVVNSSSFCTQFTNSRCFN
jgi:hypothetical protein